MRSLPLKVGLQQILATTGELEHRPGTELKRGLHCPAPFSTPASTRDGSYKFDTTIAPEDFLPVFSYTPGDEK